MPSYARLVGLKVVSESPLRLRVYLSESQHAQFIADVRKSRMVAVTASDVLTFRTLQYKGSDAVVEPLRDNDRAVITAYGKLFDNALQALKFAPQFTRAFLDCPGDEVAIEFTPSDAFQQTPGAQAGDRL